LNKVLRTYQWRPLGRSGFVGEIAQGHSIAKDEFLLVDGQGGYKNFCVECAEPVLDKRSKT
jgi:hypothetical protein